MPRLSILKLFILVAAMSVLAACQDSEEKAETHFQNALALIAEGDTARASVEFRNVFEHNGFHRDARASYAAMLRRQGDVQQAYGQFLRLVEQYPEDAEGRIALAEMAIAFQNWDEARRHGARALLLAPDDPAIPIITLNLAYLDALDAEDVEARDAAIQTAAEMLEEDPDNLLLRRILIDGLLLDGDLEGALAMLDSTILMDPDSRILQETRLSLLAELERADDFELALRQMIRVFPEDEVLPRTLLSFYFALGELEAAEVFLRELAAVTEDDRDRSGILETLVMLRLERDGATGATAELDRILAEDPSAAARFRIMRAALRFDLGARDEAMAELAALLDQGLTSIDAGRARVALARMHIAEGDEVAARGLVEAALAEDGGQIDALKMLAVWLIEEDRAGAALQRLRTALEENPDDPETLTLMADAHARNGNRELMREFLSRAVAAADSAPPEALRYVGMLVDDGRFPLAEDVLDRALRRAPDNPDLLLALGNVYMRSDQWARAEQVERRLRRLGTETGLDYADRLRTAVLFGRGQADEALEFLEELSQSSAAEGSSVEAQIAVVRARLATGDGFGARAYAEELLEEDPGNATLRFLLATIHMAQGRYGDAEALYRGLVEEDDSRQAAWIGLIRALGAQNRPEDAQTMLDRALEVLPDAPDLLWAQASYLERVGAYQDAIAVYEELYERLPGSVIVANNLASLLSVYGEGEDILERAYTIARRLRGTDVPQFQDTYGWIAYRRGEYEEALAHLEPAALSLSTDPLAQYHLGMTYLALDRPADALRRLSRAVQLAGPRDPRPQFESAREEIRRIEAMNNTDQ
jgi:tetratricopeptide (TPR) repeat protein